MTTSAERQALDRRRLLKAGVWSVPIISLAAAAPAFAASPVACPTFPTTGYTETTSGTLNNAPRGFTGAGTAYRMNTDANTPVATPTITTTSPTIAVVNGTTYNLSILIQTQYGVNVNGNGPVGTRNTNFTPSVFGSITGGTVTLGPYSTQPAGGGTLVTPINGGYSTGTTATLTFTASATGTVQVRFAFSMSPTTSGNNDDYLITPTFASCLR